MIFAKGVGPDDGVLFEDRGDPVARSFVTDVADAAGSLRKHDDVGNRLRDVLHVIFNLQQETIREARTRGARAEVRGTAGNIFEAATFSGKTFLPRSSGSFRCTKAPSRDA